MVFKAIGLKVDVFPYHLSSHSKRVQAEKVIYRFIGCIYWRYLFTGFIYLIWWLYLLDLSIGFIHWLYLFILFIYSYSFIRFGGFIYRIYLLTLVSVHTVSIPTAFSFSQSSTRNIFTKLFTGLLALAIGAIYSLALFSRFSAFTYWNYLLALFIGFIYALALFIQFGSFIYWVYLLTLALVYTVSTPAAFPFSHISVRNTFTILSL